MSAEYAIVALEDLDSSDGGTPGHRSVTDALGCSATTVDAYRLDPDQTITPEPAREQLCVPVGADESLTLGGSRLPPTGLARLPAGVERVIAAPAATSLVVIGAAAEPFPDADPTVVDLDACEFAVPSTSSIETARLTAALGCGGMKVNARILHPGQRVPYHTEGDQEELFVPVRGPASMRVDGEPVETSVGTVTRVAPPVPRSAVNDGESDACWVMVGAPPTGAPDEWDPGAEILE